MSKQIVKVEEETTYKNNMILGFFSVEELKERCSDNLYNMFCDYMNSNMALPDMKKSYKNIYDKVLLSTSDKIQRNILFEDAKNSIPKPFIHPSLDEEAVFDFINKYNDPTIKEIRKKIIDKLDYITYDDFMRKFSHIVEEFKQNISGEGYAIVSSKPIDEKGSEFRLADIAREITHHKKGKYNEIYIGDIGITKKYLSSNIVIFDDISYSGTQILSTLLSIEKYGEKEKKKIKIYINIAYFSSLARRKIDEFYNECSYITLIFPSKEYVGVAKTYKDILTEEELKVYEEKMHYYSISEIGITYTERKVPDMLSFDPRIALLFKPIFRQYSLANSYKNPFYTSRSRGREG